MDIATYKRIEEKWIFGDITQRDCQCLIQVLGHFHPSLKALKPLSEVCRTAIDWKELDACFIDLANEFGLVLKPINRLENVRQITQKMFDELLQTITDDEIAFICKADYGQKIDRHATALKQLIFEQNGIFQEGQIVYPHEVVILSRHFVELGHEREFIFANMIMVHNLLWGRYSDDCITDYYSIEPKVFEFSKVSAGLLGEYMKYVLTADRFLAAVEENPHYFKGYQL